MSRNLRLVLLLIGILSLVGIVLAIAPGTKFELEGNAKVDGTACTGPNNPVGCKDDWNLLNGTTGFNGSAGGSAVRTFIPGNDEKIFTTGASKDPLDTSGWQWKAADTVPDKDFLTNGYAAEYTNGSTVFVFGAERFAVNGDSNIGIWFFQNQVEAQDGGGFGPEVHKTGDVFAVSAFTSGGTNPTISVYKWEPACNKAAKAPVPAIVGGSLVNFPPATCAAANLSLQFASATGSTCTTGDLACAVVNGSGPIDVSWPYTGKDISGNPQTDPATNAFFEGGIDIGELFPTGVPCFSSFLLETRSSQEPSSVLKDFLSGAFDTCKIELTKDCNCTSFNTATSDFSYTATGIVHNAGQRIVYAVTVTDDRGTALDTSDDFVYNCGDLTPDDGAPGGTDQKQWPNQCTLVSGSNPWNVSTPRPTTNNATAVAHTTPGGTGTGDSTRTADATAPCQNHDADVCKVNPSIDAAQACRVSLTTIAASAPQNSVVVVTDHYEGTVTISGNEKLNVRVRADNDNDASFNEYLQLTVAGVACGSPTTACVMSPAQTARFTANYFPYKQNFSGSLPLPTAGTGRASFENSIRVESSGVVSGTLPNLDKPASCVICPGPQSATGQCSATADVAFP